MFFHPPSDFPPIAPPHPPPVLLRATQFVRNWVCKERRAPSLPPPPPPSPPSSLLFPYIARRPIRVQRGRTKRKGAQGGTRSASLHLRGKGGGGGATSPRRTVPVERGARKGTPCRSRGRGAHEACATPFAWNGVRARACRAVRAEGGARSPRHPIRAAPFARKGGTRGDVGPFAGEREARWHAARLLFPRSRAATPITQRGLSSPPLSVALHLPSPHGRASPFARKRGARGPAATPLPRGRGAPLAQKGQMRAHLPPLPLPRRPVRAERGRVKAKPPPSYGAAWKGAHVGELSPARRAAGRARDLLAVRLRKKKM
ncbi:hypothetical protein H4582DRAFT_2064874 [Lactarius indigo]|nr:hypothetical protein H4582DRAFT_2064874 [Lactarius indigo]